MPPFTPSVSVLIPTYNRADILGQALRSVFQQTISPSEVIVIDDGSIDATEGAVQRALAENPEWARRLHYVRQSNAGKSAALNRGLACVRSEWIAYNDSDDLWLPTKLEKQFAAIARFPSCGMCFTDSRFVNNPEMNYTAFSQARRRYRSAIGWIPSPLRHICTPPHGIYMQSVLVRRDVMQHVGGFDPRFWVAQDTDFVFRLARETPFCYVNEPLVLVDRRADRKTGLTTEFDRRSLGRLAEAETMFEKWLGLVPIKQSSIRRRIRTLLRNIRSEIGGLHLRAGDYPAARVALLSALHARFSPAVLAKCILVSTSPHAAAQLWRTYRRVKTVSRLPRLHAVAPH